MKESYKTRFAASAACACWFAIVAESSRRRAMKSKLFLGFEHGWRKQYRPAIQTEHFLLVQPPIPAYHSPWLDGGRLQPLPAPQLQPRYLVLAADSARGRKPARSHGSVRLDESPGGTRCCSRYVRRRQISHLTPPTPCKGASSASGRVADKTAQQLLPGTPTRTDRMGSTAQSSPYALLAITRSQSRHKAEPKGPEETGASATKSDRNSLVAQIGFCYSQLCFRHVLS